MVACLPRMHITLSLSRCGEVHVCSRSSFWEQRPEDQNLRVVSGYIGSLKCGVGHIKPCLKKEKEEKREGT